MESASEDEELFNQQYNNFKVMIDDLDKQRLEEFWIFLDHHRAEVKRKRIQRTNEEEPPKLSRRTKALCYKVRC